MRRGISSVMAMLLLTIIAVAAAVILYVWITGSLHADVKSSSLSELIRIEGYRVDGNLLYLYVRNIGSVDVVVTRVYIVDQRGSVVVRDGPAVIKSGTEIWGGDVWTVDSVNLKCTLKSTGKVLHDTFTSRNPAVWDDSYVNYKNYQEAIYYDPDGLKLLSNKRYGAYWAVRGLITRSKIMNLHQLSIVIEVDLKKTNYKIDDGDAAGEPFAACLYLSPSKRRNPYYATPWFATKLYPRDDPSRTEAQLVTKRGAQIEVNVLSTWYSAPNSQPRGVFLLVFNESNKVYYYFWRGSRSGVPFNEGAWSSSGLIQVFNSGQVYVYLTIDNTVALDPGEFRKVHVRYLQIYKGTKVKVEGLSPGWTVQITDLDWNVIEVDGYKLEVVANSSSVEIELLPYILKYGMPLDGHIKVITGNLRDFEENGGWLIPVGDVRVVTVSLEGVSSGRCRVKVVTLHGTEASCVIMKS